MRIYVLDTSVVIKWFSRYDEHDLENAYKLRREISAGSCAVSIPGLLIYEFANALRYNPRFNSQDVKAAVNSVMNMGFEVNPVETVLITQAIELAFKFKVTVYDACYLALAQMKNIPLITADYKLADKITGFKNLIRLADV